MRNVYPRSSVPGKGLRWEWHDDVRWVAYDIPTSKLIEREFRAKNQSIDLSKTPLAIPNVLEFCYMRQTNKHTGFQRDVQRLTRQCYPVDSHGLSLAGKLPSKGQNASTVNGYTTPSHSTALKTGVSGRATRASTQAQAQGKQRKKVKVNHSQGKVFNYCNLLLISPGAYTTS